jgi:hypothetical protein
MSWRSNYVTGVAVICLYVCGRLGALHRPMPRALCDTGCPCLVTGNEDKVVCGKKDMVARRE